MSLNGKRVVLFGGTSGIGLATAVASARAGAEVVVVSSRQSSVDTALAELPTGAEGHVVDLTDHGALEAFFDAAAPFDHLVITAGEGLRSMPLAEYDATAAREFFELRFFTALQAIHLASPILRQGGSIVLTSGTAAFRPAAGWTLGSAICNAVIGATKALAVELAPIRVNAVAPGIVRSPLWAAMSADDQAQMYAAQAASIPAGRVAETSDVAQAYVALMESDFVTGTISVVDGGTILV